MNEERCILCNRAYEYDKYKLFGRGCLSNLYNLLSISTPPRGTKDKEMYLCNKIAHRNFKFFLSKKKKFKLAEKYIALIKNKDWKELDERIANGFIESFSFIFDVTKISNPIFYAGFYAMQYMFWEIVVAGGLFLNLKLSSILLQKSLVSFGQ